MEQHERCECHDCTQVRYRMSFQSQLDRALGNYTSDGPISSPATTITLSGITKEN